MDVHKNAGLTPRGRAALVRPMLEEGRTHAANRDMTDHRPTECRITAPDAIFEMLQTLHESLDKETSARLNAKLVLLLANHIGALRALEEALAAARREAAGQTASPRVAVRHP